MFMICFMFQAAKKHLNYCIIMAAEKNCVCVQALHPVQLIQCISSVIMIQNLHIVIIV